MDEITFEDVLSHYEHKIKDSYEELHNIQRSLNMFINEIDSAWCGQAADSFKIKVELTTNEIKKTESELLEAIAKLSNFSKMIVDDNTTMI